MVRCVTALSFQLRLSLILDAMKPSCSLLLPSSMFADVFVSLVLSLHDIFVRLLALTILHAISFSQTSLSLYSLILHVLLM